MLGKAMRIATLCTLAFAICGERTKAEAKEEEKTSRTVPSKTSKNGRWLAKSLLLGASVHAASGFVQPPHPARGLGRPAGVRALEPLKGWGRDTINEKIIGNVQKGFASFSRRMRWGTAGKIKDALVVAERIEDVLVAAEVRHRLEGQDVLWEERKPQLEIVLQDMKAKKLEERWLGVMVENARSDAAQGHYLLAKIDDETSFLSSRAEWNALEDDVRVFQKWQEYGREHYDTISHKFTTPAGVRALETLKGAMNVPLSNLHQAQQLVKAEKISDVLAAAQLGHHFNVDGIPWEEYDIDRIQGEEHYFNVDGIPWDEFAISNWDASPGPFRPKLQEHLQSMKGKSLENLWRSVRSAMLEKRMSS